MKPVLVIGAGGHARVVISILRELGQNLSPAAVYDINAKSGGKSDIMGVEVFSGEENLQRKLAGGMKTAILAMGDNKSRRAAFEKLTQIGFEFPNLISQKATLDPTVKMGRANVICAHAHVGPLVVFGDNNLLNTRCTIEHEGQLGSHSHLAPHSVLLGRVHVGDALFLGAAAVVRQSLKIASHVTIGAGGVVVEDVIHSGVYIGVPAKPMGSV